MLCFSSSPFSHISGDIAKKKKWKNIRDRYAKYLRNTRTTTGQENLDDTQGRYQYAEQLEALKPYFSFASTRSNVTAPNTPSQGEESGETGNREEENEIFENSENSGLQRSDESTELNTRRNRKREMKESSVNSIINYLENKKKKTSSIDLIMQGYAETIKTFSYRRQVLAKIKIAEIINELELAQAEENEHRPNVSSQREETGLNSFVPVNPELAQMEQNNRQREEHPLNSDNIVCFYNY